MKKTLLGVSLTTVACLYGLLAVILIAVALVTGIPVTTALAVSLGVLVLQFLVGPFFTDLSMRWFYKASFDREIPAYLRDFIQKICDENNMRFPRMGFIDDGAPNAFTYGRTKNDARIVLTRGIFEMLDEEEVKAVVAHELGHARHYDMLFMTVVQLVPLVLYYVYELLLRGNIGKSDSSSDNNEGGSAAAVGIVAYVLYIICQYIVLWLSRTREYFADEFSARTTKNPNALASALVKIGFGLSTRAQDENVKHSASKQSTLGISDVKSSMSTVAASVSPDGQASKQSIKNAMKWDLWNYWAKWYELNSTHPLISKRILAISRLSPEYGQEPYIEFNEPKDRSYGGLFVKELFIHILPSVAFIATAAATAIYVLGNSGSGTIVLGGAFRYIVGIGCALTFALSLLKYRYKHPKNFERRTVEQLMAETTVSGVTAIPCEIEGTIVGRGDPGCIFDENYVIHDHTGIVLLNYNQPLKTINKIFALFFAQKNIDQRMKVVGWFRRSPVPYVEMLYYTVGDKTKTLYSYKVGYIVRFVILLAALAFIFIPLT